MDWRTSYRRNGRWTIWFSCLTQGEKCFTLKHSVSEQMSRQQPEKHLNETIDSCAAGCHNLSFNEKKICHVWWLSKFPSVLSLRAERSLKNAPSVNIFHFTLVPPVWMKSETHPSHLFLHQIGHLSRAVMCSRHQNMSCSAGTLHFMPCICLHF